MRGKRLLRLALIDFELVVEDLKNTLAENDFKFAQSRAIINEGDAQDGIKRLNQFMNMKRILK